MFAGTVGAAPTHLHQICMNGLEDYEYLDALNKQLECLMKLMATEKRAMAVDCTIRIKMIKDQWMFGHEETIH